MKFTEKSVVKIYTLNMLIISEVAFVLCPIAGHCPDPRELNLTLEHQKCLGRRAAVRGVDALRRTQYSTIISIRRND